MGVEPVATSFTEFLEFPFEVYGGDRNYCAPSLRSTETRLRRLTGAGEAAAWVARESSRVVGRIAARFRPEWRDPTGERYGVIGWFEALPRPDASHELLDRALAWLAARGAAKAYGPMDGDTWHSYRFAIDSFEVAPFLLEPYNPPYYPETWRAHGFALAESYVSQRIDAPQRVRSHLETGVATARAAGYRIRPFDEREFEAEVSRIYELSRRAFAHNLLYTEVERGEFLGLYSAARRLLDPAMLGFALSPAGEEVGFVFAYPDRFRAAAAMRGASGALGIARFLSARGRPEAANLKTVGVLPGHRRHGLAAALLAHAYDRILEVGYDRTHHCLIREDNPSERLDGGAGTILRRYELYVRRVAA